jgi:DNA-binding transcriptional ArsR family regulator
MPSVLERNVEELTCDAYNDDPSRVRRVARVMPPDAAFETASAFLKAMADPVRARILFALTVEPLCVCELATLLAMSMPAVSHHLKVLTLTGLLKARKVGKFACYRVTDDRVTQTLTALVPREQML